MLPLALIPLAASAVQAGVGLAQAAKGKASLKKSNRPVYQTPEEIKKNTAMAEQEATYGLGGASKQLYSQGADRSTAAALYGAGTRKAGLAGLSGVVQAGQDAALNMAAMDQDAQAAKKRIAMGARSEQAGYKNQEFEYNKAMPYEQKVTSAQANIGAGMQNVMGGLNTAATVGLYGMGGDNALKDTTVTEDVTVTDPTANLMQDNAKKQAWWNSLSPEQKAYFSRRPTLGK